MPTLLTTILVSTFLSATLLILAGREVVTIISGGWCIGPAGACRETTKADQCGHHRRSN